MYQPLIKFHPYPAIITQVLCIFALRLKYTALAAKNFQASLTFFARLLLSLHRETKTVGRSVAVAIGKGGKSGQHRAFHFLTESCLRGQSNAEENNRPSRGKGEKVG